MTIAYRGKMSVAQLAKGNASMFLGQEFAVFERLNAIEVTDSGNQVLRLDDNEQLKFGTGAGATESTNFDVFMRFDATNLEMLPYSDDLCAFNIGDGTTDMDFKIFMGATTSHVVFDNSTALVTFTKTRMIMGAQGTGVSTSTAALNVFEVHGLTASAITADGTGLSCGIRCRYEIGAAQTNQVSLIAVEGRLRIKAAVADGAHAGVNGGIEADGATAFTGTATTQRAGAHFYLELGASCTFGSTSGWLTGVTIDSSVHATQVGMTNITFAGLRIKKATGKHNWEYGIYIQADSIDTNAIYIPGGSSMVAVKLGTLSSSSAGSGITLDATNTRALEVNADDDDTARATGTNNRAIMGRLMIYEDNACEDWGIHGLSKMSAVAKTGNVSAGVTGAFETTGTCSTATGAGNTYCAGVMGRVGTGGSFTIGAGTKVACFLAFGNNQNSNAFTNAGYVGICVAQTDIGTAEVFDVGLDIEASSCVAGITIGACAGHGVSVSGTFTTASSRSFKSDMTIANPDYGDGYSANEFQLNITGTAAGHISAGGMWVNITSGTHNDSNFICAQTNGVYQAAGTITGKVVIFGMRMAHQCTNNGSTYFYPWSIVSAGGLNDTTALIHCNAAAVNLGAVANAGSGESVLVPLYQEGAGGNIGYVKIYSLQ